MDWPSFLTANHVSFVEKGRNVSRGNLAIKCPFCVDDPSEHLNVSLSGRGFYCLRNRQHSGSEARLVQALMHTSYEQALMIVQGGRVLPDDWFGHVMSLVNVPVEEPVVRPLAWPDEFRQLDNKIRARPFWHYLQHSRNYNVRQIEQLWQRWRIAYCVQGAFHQRIIFPVYFEQRLATWTGRAVSPNVGLRYKTLTADSDKAADEGTPVALGPISNYLLFWDHLIDCDADTIVLCEGPFDALRIMTLGWDRGIVATCFFTAQPGPMQIDLLHELLPLYRHRHLMLDAGTWGTGMRVTDSLAALRVERLDLPLGIKDPDLLTVEALDLIL